MRFGIAILPDQRWSVAGRRWRSAEEYGFDHAWTYDHLGWRDLVDGPWFDAVPTLTAAAMVTRRIRLGTFVASPNFRHPVRFAREITALDDISQGRLLLGTGAGGVGFDATVLGEPELTPGRRVDRFTEFVTLLDAVLTGDRVTWQGEFYSAVDARSTPGPVQRPRPPLLIAANAPRTLALAARLGDGWITTGRPDPAGMSPSSAPPSGASPSGAAPSAEPPFAASPSPSSAASPSPSPSGASPSVASPSGASPSGASPSGASPSGASPSGGSSSGGSPFGASFSGTAPAAERWWASVAELSERFTEALDKAGRSGADVPRYLSLDSSPIFSLSSADAFTDAVGRAAALGFTDVVTHWPRESSWYAGDEKVLETVAGLLPRLRSL